MQADLHKMLLWFTI